MRRNVRVGWIAAGGLLSASAVLVVALGLWFAVRLPHDYDFALGSYDSADLGRRTTEVSTVTYAITTPVIVVHAAGPVRVMVALGPAGRLAVRREMSWEEGERDFEESWRDGTTLDVRLGCPRPRSGPPGACRATYTLTAPTSARVELRTPSGAATCAAAGPEPAACEVSAGPPPVPPPGLPPEGG
ncbi:hypothetical protein Ssi03_72910 [Sphaerisporangium siamense]|uniref:Uncharacterized protein n=1 Tax=Sphaerisporangium siamense TaxID=795645 RepID=A0A7W7DAR5_9ACTN|nr:hypothetical protein [Sphaerisporangium siamense]MBB4703114.1 hypothetical protein [Sphaerisporangium siamense]GII89301.1 hypothetical protein Ssi03_72910 [Sphaerisporangium siamense]